MTQENIKDHIPDYVFFLFINTKSGGKTGMRFFNLQIQTLKFLIRDLQIRVSFYDLNNQKSKEKGFKQLKLASQNNFRCRVIVGGGDGTVLWVTNQIIKHNIKIQNIPIGILPIGTGNDFSRSLGWGGEQSKMIGKKFETFKILLNGWINSDIQEFDLWELRFQVFQNGYLKRMKGSQGSQPLSPEEYNDKTFYVRNFANYCSFGGDGRVGYSFDKYRTNSRILNLLVYTALGLVKVCKKIPKIEQFVQKMEKITTDSNEQSKNTKSIDTTTTKLVQKKIQKLVTVFDNQNENNQIEYGFQNLLALNINSFMGGAKNMWNTDKNGVRSPSIYRPLNSSDGNLQFLSWKGEFCLGIQRIYNNASKITQGTGPFIITFKQFTQQFYTYLQIDGEYFKVVNPKSMIIKKSGLTPSGTIKVLRNRNQA